MRTQINKLLNISKLKTAQQEKAINAFDKLILETGHPDDSLHMRVLVHALSAHKLNEDVQTALRSQLSTIIEYERHNTPIPASFFKWDSSSTPAQAINEEVKKANFRWGKNQTVKIDGGTEVIKKSSYKWRD